MKNNKKKLLIGLFSTCAVAFCIAMCINGFNHNADVDNSAQFNNSELTASVTQSDQENVSTSNIQEQDSLEIKDNNKNQNSSQSTAPEKQADKPSGHVAKIDDPELIKDYQDTIVNAKPDFTSFLHANDDPDIGWSLDKEGNDNVLHVGKAENYDKKFISTLGGYKKYGWYNDRTKIDKVIIDEEVSFISCAGLFGCIDPVGDKGEEVELMNICQFEGLDKIYLTDSKFNGDASYMFVGCDWANTNTLPKGLDKVTNAKSMFNYTAISEADKGNGFSNEIMHKAAFELTSATDLKYAFANNKLFKDFDGSNLKFGNVTDMRYMLYNDPIIKEIDIRGWTSFPEKNKNWVGNIIDLNNVYIYCNDGIKETVKQTLPSDTEKKGKWKLQEPSAWWGVTGDGTDKTLYLSALPTVNATQSGNEILNGFNRTDRPWKDYYNNITCVIIEKNIHLKFNDCGSLFENLSACKEISGLEMFDTSKVQNMTYMFFQCRNLTQLDLSFFTNKAITKEYEISLMFANCVALETIKADPKKWEKKFTGRTTSVFNNCANLVGHSKDGCHSTSFHDEYENYACVDVDDSNPGYFTDVDYKPTPIAWQAMQAEANGEEKPIDFYPAFNSASDVEGYKFAVKNGDEYQEIENSQENPISMESIYHKLQEAKTKTLYYHKTDSSKAALKCYTTRNLSWKDVFNQDQGDQGVAKSYNLNFVADYQTKNGIYNGIVTAEIGVGGDTPNTFGSGWDNNEAYSKDSPKINNVDYSHNGSGFYKSYGGSESTVLSTFCAFPFGSYYHRTSTDVEAFYYSTEEEIWATKRISTAQSVVLAKEFGGPEKPQLKSLILKEIIGGVKQNVQYFPIAGDSLGENIKFYDANQNPLQKTGADGKYKQSDLTRAVLYTGDGSFKTLRSILESWYNTFDLEGWEEGTAKKIKKTFIEKYLVGGNEDTEQVYRFNGGEPTTTTPPTYDGVSLTEIWDAYKSAGFGGSCGRFWSATAKNKSEACIWNSYDMQWYIASRNDPNYYYVLACREFNSALH